MSLDLTLGKIVSQSTDSERAEFIKKTYMHLIGAIVVFTILETIFFKTGLALSFTRLISGSRWSWLLVLGAFMFVSHYANKWAHSDISKDKQYLGLGVYIVIEAIIFMPLLFMATMYAPSVLKNAIIITVALVAGLTFIAFFSKTNFSFLRQFLTVGGFIAMGLIIASIVFSFTLGIIFSGAMILFAAGAILYSTSSIIHEYHTEQYVAASLSLFASVALLFWYVIQFLMDLTGR